MIRGVETGLNEIMGALRAGELWLQLVNPASRHNSPKNNLRFVDNHDHPLFSESEAIQSSACPIFSMF